MLSVAERDVIMLQARAEAEGVLLVQSADLQVEVQETSRPDGDRRRPVRRILVRNGGEERYGTARFKRNLLRMTGITSRLMIDLPLSQLNSDIRHQMTTKHPAVGYIRTAVEGVDSAIGVFPATRPYLSYLEAVPASDLALCKGSPIEDDALVLQTLEQSVDIGENFPLLVGLHARVSSTGLAKTRVHFGFFRSGCQNSAVDVGFGGEYLRDVDPTIFAGVVSELRGRMDEYVSNVTEFIGRAREYCVEEVEFLEPALNHLSLPKKMKELLVLSVSHPDELGDLFDRAGVPRVSSLWDAYNVLTHLGSLAPTASQQATYAEATTRWAQSLLDISRN